MGMTLHFDFCLHHRALTTNSLVYIHLHAVDPLSPFRSPPTPFPLVTTTLVPCISVFVFVWFGLLEYFLFSFQH